MNSNRLEELAALGTSCPDHFLRTKIRPLVVPADADDAALDRLVEAYRQDYAGYYERCRHPDSPAMRDPNAVVYLVPGVGMLTFARDKATARIAGEFYVNAINVMRGAAGVDRYVGLPEQEAFDIEYWLLEEAKLQRLPKPKALAGRVALVTGGAGGIGGAVARRLLAEGACVVLTDIDGEALDEAERSLVQAAGRDLVHAVRADVTDEAAVAEALGSTVERFGGIDIVVANAGLATAAAFAETSLADWEKNNAVLAKGVFLVTREAFKVMLAQKMGGSIVTIGSKNALAASAGASAYCAAKAAAVHLTRCIALEGAPHGIRANVVNPDAVLRGSRIWGGDWRKARADGHGHRREPARGGLPPALAAQAQRLSGGHRRGRVLLRERGLGQVDRQHPERRRRQPDRLHAVRPAMTVQDRPRTSSPSTTPRPRPTSPTDYAHLGRQLARRGIDIERDHRRGAGASRWRCRPGAWAPAGRGSAASRARASRAGSRRSSRTAPPSSSWCGSRPRSRRTSPGTRPTDLPGLVELARSLGLGFDAVNSNTFQDQPGQRLSYKFGSLTHTDAAVREQAVAAQSRMHRARPGRWAARRSRSGSPTAPTSPASSI